MPIELPVTIECSLIRKHYVSKEFRIFTDSRLCSIAEVESAAEIIGH